MEFLKRRYKLVLVLTILPLLAQEIIAYVRFGTFVLDVLGMVMFLLAGFLSAACLTYILSKINARQGKIPVAIGYVLSYPLFLFYGLLGGLIIGWLAPVVAVLPQAVILFLIYGGVRMLHWD